MGKRACVEPLKNKIEILKIDVIMIVTIIRLDSCNKDYYIKKGSDCTKRNTIIKVKFYLSMMCVILK